MIKENNKNQCFKDSLFFNYIPNECLIIHSLPDRNLHVYSNSTIKYACNLKIHELNIFHVEYLA